MRFVLEKLTFASGSMGPKVEAACEFARITGGMVDIGAMEDAAALLGGDAGTTTPPKLMESNGMNEISPFQKVRMGYIMMEGSTKREIEEHSSRSFSDGHLL